MTDILGNGWKYTLYNIIYERKGPMTVTEKHNTINYDIVIHALLLHSHNNNKYKLINEFDF